MLLGWNGLVSSLGKPTQFSRPAIPKLQRDSNPQQMQEQHDSGARLAQLHTRRGQAELIKDQKTIFVHTVPEIEIVKVCQAVETGGAEDDGFGVWIGVGVVDGGDQFCRVAADLYVVAAVGCEDG